MYSIHFLLFICIKVMFDVVCGENVSSIMKSEITSQPLSPSIMMNKTNTFRNTEIESLDAVTVTPEATTNALDKTTEAPDTTTEVPDTKTETSDTMTEAPESRSSKTTGSKPITTETTLTRSASIDFPSTDKNEQISDIKLVTSLPKINEPRVNTEFIGVQPFGSPLEIPIDIPDFLRRPLQEDYEDYEMFARNERYIPLRDFRQRPTNFVHPNLLPPSIQLIRTLMVRGNDSHNLNNDFNIKYEDENENPSISSSPTAIVGRGSFREIKNQLMTKQSPEKLIKYPLQDWGTQFLVNPPSSSSSGFIPSAGPFGLHPYHHQAQQRYPPLMWRIPVDPGYWGSDEAGSVYQRFWPA